MFNEDQKNSLSKVFFIPRKLTITYLANVKSRCDLCVNA
jgi:hypothetical protein